MLADTHTRYSCGVGDLGSSSVTLDFYQNSEMPRRKQDKPQHLEEDNADTSTMTEADKTELITKSTGPFNGNVTDMNNSTESERDSESTLPLINGGDKQEATEPDEKCSLPLESDGMEDEDPGDIAVITNEDWRSVKSTMTSIQQQCHIIRMQQFQFMQLLSSQNKSSTASNTKDSSQSPVPNHETITPLESTAGVSTEDYGTEESVMEELEKEQVHSNPDIDSPSKEPDVYAGETHTEIDMVANDSIADETLGVEMGKEETEDFNASQEWQEIEDQAEPPSFDCTQCSAVLPNPELLKMHMVTHQKRHGAPESSDRSPNRSMSESYSVQGSSSALLHGSSAQSTLPPSYQSIISDLSNDSMEEYMEIQKPQNTHLEQLVKNMDGVVTDPNQCLICKRPLSCKSALMMHYRTHTGERPFKCRLCNRAFTTKGNLKTHFGVHRAKPPMRMMHTCPVCSKQFSNHLVLQQHMKIHEDLGSPSSVSRKRPIDLTHRASTEERKRLRLSQDHHYKQEPLESIYSPRDLTTKRPDMNPMFTSSLAPPTSGAFPFDFSSVPSIQDQLRYADALSRQWEQLSHFSMFNPMAMQKPNLFSPSIGMNGTGVGLPFPLPLPQTGLRTSYPSPDAQDRDMARKSPDKTKQMKEVGADDRSPSVTSHNDTGMNDSYARHSNNSPKSEKSWNSGDTSAANSTSTNTNGMRIDPPPGTTCDICGKQHGCRSALEIHYRSHTKHRPFKCEICDKAFTTRGNMKQHILTHKPEEIQWSAQIEKTTPSQVPSPTRSEIAAASSVDNKKLGGRHQCHVCLKGFSSSSAVQIHLRTHTGDRPFKCPDCGKAFTTKGNLKVHQGTHSNMWSGKPSPPPHQRHMSIDEAEANKVNHHQEQTNPITSPFNPIPPQHANMNNNNLNWNGFSQNALMKATLMGNPALMANYSNLFLPQLPIISANDDAAKPWLWQVTCHICNKECQSPVALELHLKTHQVSESSPTPVPAS